jgi:hypothetical protein
MLVTLKILESKEPWRVFHREDFEIEDKGFLKVFAKYFGPMDTIEIFFEPATWHCHIIFPFKGYGFNIKKYKNDFIDNKKRAFARRKREIANKKALKQAKGLVE